MRGEAQPASAVRLLGEFVPFAIVSKKVSLFFVLLPFRSRVPQRERMELAQNTKTKIEKETT